MNDIPVSSPSLLWEAAKAVLRGKMKEKEQEAELEQKNQTKTSI